MIELRKSHPALGLGDFKWVDAGNDAVAAYTRRYQDEHILVLNNLSDEVQKVCLEDLAGLANYEVLFASAGESVTGFETEGTHSRLQLSRYAYLWIKELSL
jgi:maltose alpha-D-glucosyltransferase/alpha-amylase